MESFLKGKLLVILVILTLLVEKELHPWIWLNQIGIFISFRLVLLCIWVAKSIEVSMKMGVSSRKKHRCQHLRGTWFQILSHWWKLIYWLERRLLVWGRLIHILYYLLLAFIRIFQPLKLFYKSFPFILKVLIFILKLIHSQSHLLYDPLLTFHNLSPLFIILQLKLLILKIA